LARPAPEESQEFLYGIHPVTEALRSGSRSIERILVARESEGNRIGRVLKEARKAGIPVSRLPKEGLARKAGRQAVHQGVVAVVAPLQYASLEEIATRSLQAGQLMVLLSGAEDPRNVGAVLRTACAAGADGVILAGENSAGVTPGAVKTSAGAAMQVAVGRAAKPVRAIRELKNFGFRVIGLDHRSENSWDDVDLGGPVVLVAGGEGRGLGRSVVQECDESVSIPLSDKVESLNLSVAVGILLYEVVRQRKVS
jgi:23S rRNA (guanosine2251-2'-O)-methyltransferase